jgi:hypothetical protein
MTVWSELKCYDSSTWTSIPTSAEAVLLYIDGRYAAPPSALSRFPGLKVHYWATVADSLMADVIDVENFDATPAMAMEWVLKKRMMGVNPIVYASDSTWSTIVLMFGQAHIILPRWWEADPDGKPIIRPNAWAKQYAWPPNTGGHYDLSVIPYAIPNPHPKPVPLPQELDDMGLSVFVDDKGCRHVAGVRNDAGQENHALLISETSAGSGQFSALDLTDIIHTQTGQTYTVKQ